MVHLKNGVLVEAEVDGREPRHGDDRLAPLSRFLILRTFRLPADEHVVVVAEVARQSEADGFAYEAYPYPVFAFESGQAGQHLVARPLERVDVRGWEVKNLRRRTHLLLDNRIIQPIRRN